MVVGMVLCWSRVGPSSLPIKVLVNLEGGGEIVDDCGEGKGFSNGTSSCWWWSKLSSCHPRGWIRRVNVYKNG